MVISSNLEIIPFLDFFVVILPDPSPNFQASLSALCLWWSALRALTFLVKVFSDNTNVILNVHSAPYFVPFFYASMYLDLSFVSIFFITYTDFLLQQN